MTAKIGRNEVCPCGSNKKYKKCCAITSSNVVDLAWQNLRKTEGTIVDKHLIPYLSNTLPAELLQAEIEEFFPEIPLEMEEHFFNQFIIPWSLFAWILDETEELKIANFDSTKTVADNYLKTHRSKLNSNEIRFLEAMSQTYYSFYNILEVVHEKSLVIKDILLGTTHIIKEKQGTHFLKRGDIIFTRLLTLDEQSIFVGMAPIVIPAKFQTDFIDFRDWLLEENEDNPLTAKALSRELDWDVLDYFFELFEYLHSNPSPILQNTDGDLIVFSKSHFKLDLSIEDTVISLLPLTLLKKSDEIFESAKKNKTGQTESVEFPWLIKGNKQHKDWKNTVMGHITLLPNKLILETNSEKRTEKGKKLLIKYLGEKIHFQQTLLETPEQKMNSLPNIKEATELPFELLQSPEISEQIKEMAKKHWENWFDSQIPALKDQTPREAAKTHAGRERLEALLLYYECNDFNTNNENQYFKADINYIKSELKME